MVCVRVVERKKGMKSYFYLQYSFRRDGNVVTKEKYLGIEIPKNMKEIEEEAAQEMESFVRDDLNEIKSHFQKGWKKLPDAIKEKHVQEIAVAFTYNTNAIEGSKITMRDARDIISDGIAPRKPVRDVKETETHAKVFLDMLLSEEKITKRLLLAWHKELFSSTKPGIAGVFRNYLIRVGSYVAPDWQDVKELMRDLMRFVTASDNANPVEFAARVHYRFEKIHPFGDGNGRVGRLLINAMLWRAGYPMLIIEYRKRRAYYRALEKDEEGFVKYFIRNYIRVHKRRGS